MPARAPARQHRKLPSDSRFELEGEHVAPTGSMSHVLTGRRHGCFPTIRAEAAGSCFIGYQAKSRVRRRGVFIRSRLFPRSRLPVGSPAIYVGLVLTGTVLFTGLPLLITCEATVLARVAHHEGAGAHPGEMPPDASSWVATLNACFRFRSSRAGGPLMLVRARTSDLRRSPLKT